VEKSISYEVGVEEDVGKEFIIQVPEEVLKHLIGERSRK